MQAFPSHLGPTTNVGIFYYDSDWCSTSLPTLYSLPGPPLSYDSAVTTLLAKGVNVAIGVVDEYAARNTRFALAWVKISHWSYIPNPNCLHISCVRYRLL